MRWQGQELATDDPAALPGLSRLAGLVRSVRTPEFAGVTFHEVHAKSALNRVPGGSPMPFAWTVNPYRGCSHGCVYCFARQTHTYLDLDAGRDFDTEIVVKTNVGSVLRKEVSSPRWRREHVAMGTNTDPYQRAEGRYRLMPEVIDALAGSGTPFSILTKGTVLARDLPRLADAATAVPVGIGVSLALLDPELQATLEPGTPSPRARLELVRRIRDAGLPCGVFIAPILPELTDSPEQLGALVRQLADAGATGVTGIALHLRPGAREWFFGWLARTRPDLVARYEQLYARGANLSKDDRARLTARVRRVAAELGIGAGADGQLAGRMTRGVPGDRDASFPAGSLPTSDGAGGVAMPSEQDRDAAPTLF
ncbi:Rv2578c family radical SAM protein [Nakamurella sp.]|uniref:Rv2578c family radical SAM protein n=1 Tax=Nakamurella sp. TaxID=1869182 RepID=UPI003B3BA5A9